LTQVFFIHKYKLGSKPEISTSTESTPPAQYQKLLCYYEEILPKNKKKRARARDIHKTPCFKTNEKPKRRTRVTIKKITP
jgi:hypothetical protein